MKQCTKCLCEKTEQSFAWKSKPKQVLHTICKECVKSYSNEWYQQNRTKHLATTIAATKRRAESIREYLAGLQLSCVECSENHPAVLDFHHVDSTTKDMNIGDMIGSGYNLQRIIDELQKCIVLCSNCHRKVHWLERQK